MTCRLRQRMIMKHRYFWFLIVVVILLVLSYFIYNKVYPKDYGHKVVVCIPVYGQSYALGEEAKRITDFDSLRIKYNGRIVTENLDYEFGFFDGKEWKQSIKKYLSYRKRSYELSAYGMAEQLVNELGDDTLICIFPGGAGMSNITKLNKGTDHYNKFINEIRKAYEKASKRGWEFYVPAICWMQGESDIIEYPKYDYGSLLIQFCKDINSDTKLITHQIDPVYLICYQANVITKGCRYVRNNYYAEETRVPQTQMELIRDDTLFWASGPVYPYDFVNESLHIDARGQQSIGILAGKSALGILRKEKRNIGLVPLSYEVKGNDIRILFNAPCPPLCFDTINVRKAENYGFNVIRPDGIDIISEVGIDKNSVVITCSESPHDCKLRYGINGDFLKGGRNSGPRGNLRDSQRVVSNWCFFFDYIIL